MIRQAIKNPYIVIGAALAILVLGIRAYLQLPADLLPQFNTAAVQIVCFYPGMPPEVMEKDIMSRLQRWTGQSVGIEHQEAKAMQSVCIVKDFFNEGVTMDTAMSQVSSYAMSDMFYLPPGTAPPMVMPFDPTASVPLCLVVVSNEQMNEQELYDIAYYELRNKLQSIQGVIAPAVYGGKLRRILAYVDRQKLEANDLSLMDVQEALKRQNVLIPAGSIKDGRQELQIYTNANVEFLEQLNDVPIKVVDGVPVLMRDIGRVENASAIQTNIVRVNGSRKAYIPIYRQPGSNTISIVNQINKQLKSIEERLKIERSEDPKMKSLVLSVAMDQSVGVKKGNSALQIAAGLGALLAGLVVLVFLRSIRLTLVVVICIPLSLLAAFFGMFASGNTINAMTLGGLALAIGILVDQSIVVLENVIRHVRMGKMPRQAAYDGTVEVALPLLVATITFAIVFLPVIFMSGLAKFLFLPLAIAASVAIISSYLISITLVPAYCAAFIGQRGPVELSRSSTGSPQRSTRETGESTAFEIWYAKLVSALIAIRFPVILIAIALTAGSFFVLNSMTGRELFPQVDSGQVSILVRMPTGTNLEATEEQVIEIEQAIIDVIGKPDAGFSVGREEFPDSNLQMLISNIGVLLDWPAAYTPNNGAMDAFILVQTKSKAGDPGIFEYVETLREKLNAEFEDEGVEFAFDTGGMMTAALNMGEPSPIHFQVSSPQLEVGNEICKEIVEVAKGIEGTADSRIAQRIDYPAIYVNVDREKAIRQGLEPDRIFKNLVSATNSSVNFDPAFWLSEAKGNHYFLGVQYRPEDLTSLSAISDIPIGGDSLRLGGVATITETTKPAVVNHRNISRVMDVFVNVKPGYDVGTIAEKIETQLIAKGAVPSTDERGALYKLGSATQKQIEAGDVSAEELERRPFIDGKKYKGRSFRLLGEVTTMRESFVEFGLGLLIAGVLVYIVMLVQFRSFIDPLIVLFTVPLGFIGVALILTLTNTNISVMVFMGMLMMVGIVVEYSIVLVDFANRLVDEGRSPKDAIIEAARVRLRPILMTSLTTWLALLPMAIGFGGSDANTPLARTIIGGVIGATALSLTVVPCLYVVMKKSRSNGSPDVSTGGSETDEQGNWVTT